MVIRFIDKVYITNLSLRIVRASLVVGYEASYPTILTSHLVSAPTIRTSIAKMSKDLK